jgi:hypothetical protein
MHALYTIFTFPSAFSLIEISDEQAGKKPINSSISRVQVEFDELSAFRNGREIGRD